MHTTIPTRVGASSWPVVALLVSSALVVKTINVTSFHIADRFYPAYLLLDPDNVYMRITIHHLAQMLFAFAWILAVSRLMQWPLRTFGFNLNGWAFSLKWVLIFCALWFLVQFGVGYLLVRGGLSADPGYPFTLRNVAGWFGFEVLLSGTSEEIMYRGLIMTLMLRLWHQRFHSAQLLGWAAVVGATVVFMVDHINFSLQPLAVTYVNPLQQVTVLIFGLFYGFLFLRTRSLVGPMLAHNLLNGVITVAGTLLYVLL
ncbi:MAG: CPBP family intramembrane glutamic endopeptidase [Caldilineaceae bacterium]